MILLPDLGYYNQQKTRNKNLITSKIKQLSIFFVILSRYARKK